MESKNRSSYEGGEIKPHERITQLLSVRQTVQTVKNNSKTYRKKASVGLRESYRVGTVFRFNMSTKSNENCTKRQPR